MHLHHTRFLSVALSIALVTPPPLPSAGSAFGDVRVGEAYSTAIEAWKNSGIIEGYDDGTFRSDTTINRAEFLKIVMESRSDAYDPEGDCFPDVGRSWYSPYICRAKAKGIIRGHPDGLFHPEREIHFVEAAKIIALAYEQSIPQGAGEWYEPYVRALESSRAIPPSIDNFDRRITRGEMVEMMWRILETRTDQPTKGFLNVKYPDLSVNVTADSIQKAATCADLRAFVAEAQASGAGMGYGRGGGPVMLMERDAAIPPSAAQKSMEESSSGRDYSQTNVQVAGVDEADVVKTDGTYLYIISNQKVRIVSAVPPESMAEVSVIDLEEGSFTPSDLYVDGNRLIVVGQRSTPYTGGPHIMMEKRAVHSMIWPGPWYDTQKAEVRIYDVTDRSKPTLERKVAVDGSIAATRRIEDNLYLIVNNPLRWGGPEPIPLRATEEDLLPTFEDSKRAALEPVARCGDVSILPHPTSPQYMTVAVVPLRSPNAEVKRTVVLGNAENIYASLSNLYVANTQWSYHWGSHQQDTTERTELFRFAFTPEGVELRAEGSVPGHLLNQFSMDEQENAFRIATTINQTWRGPETAQKPSTNNLSVLNLALERVGGIEDIAPGEQIYSVRFLGERAYMVTFQQIDPFFVIDLRDTHHPRILGKLKIPGYSDYLHPYDENHVIGFGKEAVEAKGGTGFAWYQGMKMALFDVSDVQNPKELHNMVVGDRGTESPLLHDHRALLFEKDHDLLAFPITVADIPADQKKGNDGSAYGQPVFQGAHVYSLTLSGGFKLRGTITHYDAEAFTKAGDRWYQNDRDIQRIVRIGGSLFTISNAELQSHTEDDVRKEGEIAFGD